MHCFVLFLRDDEMQLRFNIPEIIIHVKHVIILHIEQENKVQDALAHGMAKKKTVMAIKIDSPRYTVGWCPIDFPRSEQFHWNWFIHVG